MENNLDMGREFDWDSVIENDGESFELLPEGDYDFEVLSFERGRHNGSEKLPPCPKAVVKIRVSDGQRTGVLTHNLMLHSKCEGLLCAFFTGVGQRKHGEKLRMDWNKVAGSKGRCKVGVRTWKSRTTGEDMKSNEIKRFYEPATRAPAPAQQSAQTSFSGGFGRFGAGPAHR